MHLLSFAVMPTFIVVVGVLFMAVGFLIFSSNYAQENIAKLEVWSLS